MSADAFPPLEMNANPVANAPCLIIHSSALVAEDLRDILESEGALEVLTAPDITQAPIAPARVVLVSGSLEKILDTPQAMYWRQHAIPVILVDSELQHVRATEAGFHTLNEPFRTEDVIHLLNKFNIF
ncbi:hypothetical protein [Jannaschia sp. CCS1]|uniref:hypothetical protein n=1 Tax=Jannaschia sp. (strain CCS1) TaxID=290400 RepID=UPI00140F7AC8|nr:hypothetical protein [Jannaschia sp. CCS1]